MKLKKILIMTLFIFLSLNSSSYGMSGEQYPEGFNWYNKKKQIEKKDKDNEKPDQNFKERPKAEVIEELPDYEKNIRALEERLKKAQRMALDNPTVENLLNNLRLEKEAENKSKIYGERRVAVAMLSSEFNNMKNHTNILHKRVQEQVDKEQDYKKLTKLSQEWGLVVQIQEGCPHCHAFAPILHEFANKYKFELIAATKDGEDFEGIEGAKDNGQMLIFNLNRDTPMLYLVKNDGKEVFPISRGINSEDQIISNIKAIDKHLRRLF